MPNSANTVRLRGRHLLDHEALTCLLVLLFVDEPKLNTTRLHRVLRNLCYHAQTRNWVIRSLLSILQRTNECRSLEEAQTNSNPAITATSSKAGSNTDKLKRKSTGESAGQAKSSSTVVATEGKSSGNTSLTQPSWLSVSLDAALGCRANVFQIQRTVKKHHSGSAASGASTSGGAHVMIHQQASPIICRHVLDTLISLAKSFPCQFLPQNKAKEAGKCDTGPGGLDSNSNKETDSSRIKENDSSSRTSSATASPAKAAGKSEPKSDAKDSSVSIPPDFWDVLVKLDSLTGSKKGKGIQRLHSSGSLESDGSANNFETAPLGQLMTMLSYPVVRRSQMLTDRLLRLLGLVSVGLADLNTSSGATTSTSSTLTMSSTNPGMSSIILP